MAAFALDLTAFARKTSMNIDAVVRKVVLDVGTSVVLKSPVGDRDFWKVNLARKAANLPLIPAGYVGGRFRGNWQYGFGHLPLGQKDVIDKSGAISIGRITAGVGALPSATGIHYIANNLPYAKRLEEGWSYRQAPHGMVMLTVVEFQTIFKKAALR